MKEKSEIEKLIGMVLFDVCGKDWRKDPNLKDTPKRITKMYTDEIFRGLKEDPPKVKIFPNKGYDQIINCSFTSFSYCAHHFLPYKVKVHFGYIPNKSYIGLSKIPRIVDYLASKPTIQENLTKEIVDWFENTLSPEGVICFIIGEHTCTQCRGVGKIDAIMRTSAITGSFKKKETREEFYEMIKNV